jgi:hypothetical protein
MADPLRCEQLGSVARARADQFRWPRIATLYRYAFDSAFASAPLTDTAIRRRLVI